MLIPLQRLVATDENGIETVFVGKGTLIVHDTVVADDKEKLHPVRYITASLVPKEIASE